MSQFQIKHNHILYTLTGSLLLFSAGFLVLSFLHPLITENSHAESKDVGTNVNLEETLPLPSVSPSSVALTLEPNAAGDFDSAAVTVGVSTNHVSGYTLTMNTVGTSTDLSHDSSSDYKIEALSGKTSATDFANLSSTASINKWGFATDNNGSGTGQTDAGYYYPVTNSENPTTIKVTDGPANVSDTQVTFATKGKDLAAGTYSNTVIFSAVANAVPTPFVDNTYMQDYAGTNACADSESWDETGKEYTLIDKRDNLSYKVRKLKDGHCWMAQNLRMNATSLSNNGHSTTLKASDNDTDLASGSFNMPSNAIWTDTSATANGAVDASVAPLSRGGSPESDATKTTARGTYYSWATAVLNTSTISAGSGIQPNSVCPKGWKLPNVDGSGSSSNTNMYYRLFNSTTEGYSGNYANFMQAFNTYFSSGASYYLAGYYNPNSSYRYIYNPGTYGYWWSSTAHSSDANYAWYLLANTSSVYPQDVNGRYYGLSVRCML